ncbi:MAG: substrate-binding domain-containing protein [Planctomycetes bacterium]|nr:substrate-binding domain-containing protein [Planctomycetota bacterium]
MRSLSWSNFPIVCLAALALAGCGSETPTGSGAGSGSSAPSADGSSSSGDIKIVILTNGSSPFWDACNVGLKDAGKELGVRVELVRNDASEGGQIRRLEQLATQDDVKGVGISVLQKEASGVAEAMQALRTKGVKVITIDSDGPADAREAFVGTNNLEGGRELGRLAAQLRPAGGKAVTFVGFAGAQNAIERIGGFKEGAASAKIEVVETKEDQTDQTKAQNNVTAAIQNHPDVNVLAGIWSYNAPAITDVIQANGRRKDFTIVTFDCEPGAIVAMDQGLIDAMVVQDPYKMGYIGAKLLLSMIKQDQAAVDELLHGKDFYDTGLKVIVPDEKSTLQSPYRMALPAFKDWLKEKGLTGS